MKWIGQHVWDFASRFRSHVYLEDVDASASTDVLVVDSDGKVSKNTSMAGDITGVTAGSLLDGGGTSGSVTLDVDLTETTEAAIADGDYILFLDGGATGDASKESLADLATLFAGTGLTASSSVINVDAAQSGITSLGTLTSLAVSGGSTLGSATVTISSTDTDQDGVYLNASEVVTGNALKIDAQAVTTGSAIKINSTNTSRSDVTIDKNISETGDLDTKGIYVDSAKTSQTGSGDTATMTGVGIITTDSDASGSAGTVNVTGIDNSANITHAGGGTTTTVGIKNTVTGAADTSTGYLSNVVNGQVDIKLVSSADAGDFCTISTTTAGATTIKTNDVDAAAADLTLDVDGSIYALSDGVQFQSPNANDPLVIIKNTANDATGPRLRLANVRGGASPVDGQDNDECGMLQFNSYDDGTPSTQTYGQIKSTIHDATSGQESGKLQIQVASHDGGVEDGLVLTGGSVDTEVDVAIGTGTSSVTTVAGDLTVSGDTLTFNSHIGRRAYFIFQGYATSDGTNYEMPQILSDNNAPFEHDTSTGSDGLTAQTTNQMMRSGGRVMPHNGVLKKWIGWSTSAGSGTVDVGLFKVTPTRNDNTNLTPVLLKNTQYTALGNTKMEDFEETSFSVTFSKGDIIYTAIKGSTSSKLQYINSTVEIEWT